MKPVEVLCVCEPLKSGVPIYVEQVVRRLENRGFHFTVACPQGSTLRKTLADTHVNIVDMEMERGLRVIADTKAVLQLWRSLRKRRFDIVHLHSSKAGLLGRLPCKLLGLRTVFTPHCFSFESVHESKARFQSYLRVEQMLGLATDRLVCVSEHEKELASKYGIVREDHISVVPCFADASRWSPRPPSTKLKEQLGIPLHAHVVGTVSRFYPQKAPIDFVTMAAALLKRCPETHFVFVGEDGPLRSEVQKYARDLGIEKRVVLRTWTDDPCAFVALMDLVVLNSLWEGLPLSLIEAMSMGKPIVATDISGTRELIINGACGLLVPPSDPEAMANAVGSLLEHPELMATLGENGRRAANSHYSIEQAVQKTADLYLELTAEPARHSMANNVARIKALARNFMPEYSALPRPLPRINDLPDPNSVVADATIAELSKHAVDHDYASHF